MVFFPMFLLGQNGLLFQENFETPSLSGWTFIDDPQPRSGPSAWSVNQNQLRQTSNIWAYDPPAEFIYHWGSHGVAGNLEWTNYTYNAVLRSSDNDGIGIIFRYQDSANYYRILLMNDAGNSGSTRSAFRRIQKFVNGEPRTLWQQKITPAYPDDYFSLTADIRGDSISAYLDGELLATVVDSSFQKGKIGVMVYANTGARFDSIMVTQEKHVYQKPDINVVFTYPVDQDRAPYLQKPTTNSIEIAWRSLIPSVGKVEYGLQKGEYTQSISELKPSQKHHLQLQNLVANTRYFYRVSHDGEVVLEESSFVTAKPDSSEKFSFLVLGDSGVNSEIQREVYQQMEKSHNLSATDFLVHVGDVHQGQGDDYDPIYFDIYSDLLSKINFYLSIGNHDTYTDNAAPYLDDFYLPSNNPDSTERYYSYRWGSGFFISLDSNIGMAIGTPQYEFLLAELESEAQKTAMWTVVFFHHPPYCEFWPAWAGDETIRRDWLPLFEQYEVDLVLNGHTHAYEKGELNGVTYVISGGGGGGLDQYARDFAHITKSVGKHHFSRVDIDGAELTFTAIDRFGEQVDRFILDKSISVDNEKLPNKLTKTQLDQNYPNPFNPQTTLQYQIGELRMVSLKVYDLMGKAIATLVNEMQAEGSYQVIFDASNLPSGTYLFRLSAGNEIIEKSMTLIK